MITIKGYIKISKIKKEFICHECGCVYDADNDSFKAVPEETVLTDNIKFICVCPVCKTTNFI